MTASNNINLLENKKPRSPFTINKLQHSGPENFKKSRPKILVKSNKSISRGFFWPNSIFCDFKIGQKSAKNQFLNLKKVKKKLPKMQFHKK